MERFVLTDAQWAKMEPHCLGKPTDPGRSGSDNRRFVEAVLWVVRTGSPWRDLPAFFGHWNTVFSRSDAWRGLRTAALPVNGPAAQQYLRPGLRFRREGYPARSTPRAAMHKRISGPLRVRPKSRLPARLPRCRRCSRPTGSLIRVHDQRRRLLSVRETTRQTIRQGCRRELRCSRRRSRTGRE